MTKYNKEHVETLVLAMNDFIKVLGRALEVNQGLIKPDQLQLQKELEYAYKFFQSEVTKYMTLDLEEDEVSVMEDNTEDTDVD